MDKPQPAVAKRRHPLRWALWVGWLAIVGAILISLAATTANMSETKLVERSFYPVVAFGFGVGALLGARWFRDTATRGSAYAACGFVALLFAVLADFGRNYFFENIFYKL